MKSICVPLWIFCLAGWLSQAQTNEPVLRLTGIISLPDFKRALLDSPGPRGEGLITLSEGERKGRLEVLTINGQGSSVDVVDSGKQTTLRIEGQAVVAATETPDSNIRLANADLAQVFDAYAGISGRTVLQHPALKATPLSLKAAAKTRSGAAAVLEQLLQRHGIASIPDGSKFVLILPSSLTNTITDRSGEIVSKTTEPAPPPIGVIDFQNADLQQVIAIYGRMVGRDLVQPNGLRAATIRLRTVNDLTKDEAAYALETLFRWNGIKVVPVGATEFRVVPVSPQER